jgi:hypothetical protein
VANTILSEYKAQGASVKSKNVHISLRRDTISERRHFFKVSIITVFLNITQCGKVTVET